MSVETTRWQVGVVGVTTDALFLFERLSLLPSIHLTGVFDSDPERRRLITAPGTLVWDQIDRALVSSEVDVLMLGGACDEQIVARAIAQNKHVVITRPDQLSSAALWRLSALANAMGRTSIVACHGQWSSSFLTAAAAKMQLGTIQSIRSFSNQQSPLSETDGRGVLHQFGYDRCDQLLQLAESRPAGVYARLTVDPTSGVDHGLLAMIEFANGCTGQLEIQTRSRLSLHTGWMLEGANASYRNNRLYTTMADGEIVDEPYPIVNEASDLFVESLINAWQGQPSKLPSLKDAARVMELIETIQQVATRTCHR